MAKGDDQNVYLAVDDFGRKGRAYREADVEATDLETVIADLLDRQHNNPVRRVSFNTAEKWSQDVSADVAYELRVAAISKGATYHFSCKTLSTDTKAISRRAAAVANAACMIRAGLIADYLRKRALKEFTRRIAFKDGAGHEENGTGDCIRAGVDRTSIGAEGRD